MPENDASPRGDNAEQTENNIPLVAIGASAGGLEPLQQVLGGVKSAAGAFLVVLHRSRTSPSRLAEVLARNTELYVIEPQDGVELSTGTVYVIPAGSALSLERGRLRLAKLSEGERLSPIDQLFRAVSSRGEQAIAVVLSGNGQDGCVGIKDVKAAGGIVLVQDPVTARYKGMPEAAIESVPVDHQMHPEELGPQLARLLDLLAEQQRAPRQASAQLDKQVIDNVLTALLESTGHDFMHYKRSTLSRRIQRRMQMLQLGSPQAYLELVKKKPAELELLFNEILIGVTGFFRDPEAFTELAEAFDSYLQKLEDGRELRVWVPACATGEEAYSVAIIVHECLRRSKTRATAQIFGTDLDPLAVQLARTGRYPSAAASDISPERLTRYFVQEDSKIRVSKEIREMLIFAPQNLITDPPFTRLDLLSCRNMLIYLEPELQHKVLSLFHYALLPGGLLFLGNSESLGSLDDVFATLDKRWKIFSNRDTQRKNRLGNLRLELPVNSRPGDRDHAKLTHDAAVSKRGIGALIDRVLLAGVPSSVVITPRGDIVYIHGRTGSFLEPAAGEPNANIFDMAREGLRLELPAAVREATRTQHALERRGLQVRTNGGYQSVSLNVRPLVEPDPLAGLLLVTLQVQGAPFTKAESDAARQDDGLPAERVRQLEAELQHARENLQGTIEEFETSNEELKSMNEELQSTNEELQSANEELETSREEMQSLNEELQTLNAELHDRNEELSQVNDDMQNLLNSTGIATLFLDRELKIKRFTTPAKRVFHLRRSDVGRPLGELAAGMFYEGLIEDAREVLRTLVFAEREVQTSEASWRLMRILPYRTAHDVIDGLVITFMDIDQLKRAERSAEQAWAFGQRVLGSLRQGLLVLTGDLRIRLANARFCEMFGVGEDAATGQRLTALAPAWQHPVLRERLEALVRGDSFEPLRLQGRFDAGSPKDILLTACALDADGGDGRFLLIIDDLELAPHPEAIKFDG